MTSDPQSSARWSPRFAALIVVLGLTVGGAWWFVSRAVPDAEPEPRTPRQLRRALFEALQPVALANCTLERFGEPHDGGYLMCGNLLAGARAAYSYGISGYDGWGCDISRRLSTTVHQYDCFDATRPRCERGTTAFHDECIAGRAFSDESGRRFDTLERQLARTGHAGARVVVKMDVEGAEWHSLAQTGDDVLRRIDQLVLELHGVEDPAFLAVVRRLQRHFHVAHLHFNNYACRDGIEPFPSDAYEVLFVNRRIARIDPRGKAQLPHPLDAPNVPDRPDCQVSR